MDYKVIKYQKNGFAIIWDESLCVQAKQCVKGFPAVFDRNREPWIDLSKGEMSEIKAVALRCPTGALSIDKELVSTQDYAPNLPIIKIMKDGPMVVSGEFDLIENGEKKKTYKMISLCRCGQSNSHPYCDGMHRKVGFIDE